MVERPHGQPPEGFLSQQLFQAFRHFPGRLAGEGHGGDLFGRYAFFSDQPGDAIHQRAGFARAGAGDDRHGFIFRADGLFLLRIGKEALLRFQRGFGCSCFVCRVDGFLWRGGQNGQAQQAGLSQQRFPLARLKHPDHAVFSVVTGLADHLARPQAADGIAHEQASGPFDFLRRLLPQDGKLRAKLMQQIKIQGLGFLAGWGHAQRFPCQFRQRNQAFKGLFQRAGGGSVRQRFHPVQHADGDFLSAHRAAPAVLRRFLRFQAALAGPVAVQVILALLRKKLDGTLEALPRFQGFFQRGIIQIARQQIRFPAQLLRGMGVGIGHQQMPVQGGEQPVHGRVGGQAGFQGVDLGR